jgi:hypothetical protein
MRIEWYRTEAEQTYNLLLAKYMSEHEPAPQPKEGLCPICHQWVEYGKAGLHLPDCTMSEKERDNDEPTTGIRR